MTTKTKSTTPKAARDFTPQDLIALELQKVIDPFGWKVDANALPHLQAAELDAVSEWLDDAWLPTPLAVWQLIMIPNQQWIHAFNNKNDVMAIASIVLHTRGEFVPPIDFMVPRLIAMFGEDGHLETRFGSVFVEADADLLQIWFGRRKAGRTPHLWGDSLRTAVNVLFNVAITAPRDEPTTATVEKPKSTARRLKPSKKDCTDPTHEIVRGLTAPKEQAAGPPSAKREPKGSSRRSETATLKATPSVSLMMIPLSDIVPAQDNHRKTFDKAKLQELADSIKQHGILQPLLLRTRPDADPPYEIIAGERRYRAAKLVGLDRVPAQIVEREGLQASLAMLEENIRREDLSPIERATAIRSLIDAHGLTQKEVGKMIGVTQGQVSNELRLLQLPPTLQQEVASGAIAPTLIRSVLPYTDLPDVLETMTAQLLADGEPYTENHLQGCLNGAILAASRSMDFDSAWQAYQNPDTRKRHFKDVSPADLKRLDVRKIDAVSTWAGRDRTFNLELFDQLNAGPLAERKTNHTAWKAKNKVKMSSSKSGKSKSAVRFFENDYKLEDAIEESLSVLLAETLERQKDKSSVFRFLLAFAAVMQEGEISDQLCGKRLWVNEATRGVIDSLTGSVADMQATFRAACTASIRKIALSVEDACAFSAVLGIDLRQRWTVTPEVLAVLTDAGRAEFADHKPGHIPDFLRPFFALKVDEPPKAKPTKSKAA